MTGNTLIVYYSFTNNVHTIVSDLQTQIDADVLRVEPAEEGIDYAANNYAVGSALISAIRNNPDDAPSYPDIRTTADNLDEYDIIIVAAPLWWSNMAAPMQTFLFRYGDRMAGKHIGLVVSSASSGISGVEADAERLIPEGNFITQLVDTFVADCCLSFYAGRLAGGYKLCFAGRQLKRKQLITAGCRRMFRKQKSILESDVRTEAEPDMGTLKNWEHSGCRLMPLPLCSRWSEMNAVVKNRFWHFRNHFTPRSFIVRGSGTPGRGLRSFNCSRATSMAFFQLLVCTGLFPDGIVVDEDVRINAVVLHNPLAGLGIVVGEEWHADVCAVYIGQGTADAHDASPCAASMTVPSLLALKPRGIGRRQKPNIC